MKSEMTTSFQIFIANVVQSLLAIGYDVRGNAVSVVAKEKPSKMSEIRTSTISGEIVKVAFVPKDDILSGRKKLSVIRTISGGLALRVEPNKPNSNIGLIGVNCKDCSGRRFTSSMELSSKSDYNAINPNVEPCTQCNPNFKLNITEDIAQ
jgi:hypothetical protein